MTTKLQMSFVFSVETDGTVAGFSVGEIGIPDEQDEENPQSPEGIVSKKIHDVVRGIIQEHNESIFIRSKRT